METDAVLILALAVLAWRWGEAGVWVLLAGGARYLFVLAGRFLVWMRAPLPESRRRKIVCVVQVATLIACVSPWPPPPWGAALAACGVVALLLSFAIDTAWLARHARARETRE